MSNQLQRLEPGAASASRLNRLENEIPLQRSGRRWARYAPTMLALVFGISMNGWAQTDPLVDADQAPQAPPPAWPVVERPDTPSPPSIRPHGATEYSIGQPTGEEQLYLEYINRARANPAAEGVLLANAGTDHPEVQSAYDFFGVDLAKMMDEFAAMEPAPPLSFNAQLIQAARLHSQDMLDNVFQGHYSWDTSTDSADWNKGPGYRLDQANYPWSRYGENVFAFAKTAFHGHAGFEVDWGPNPDGMQGPPRGHRENLHDASFREIGIGVLNGSNTADRNPFDVGPQLVTQDLASRFNLDPFITGVVYEDLNDNDFYDVGEGLGGVTVDVAGSQFHAVTGSSGGYSVPVPANMSHTVTFSGAGVLQHMQMVAVGTDNVKVDYQAVRGEPVVTIGTVAQAPGGGLRIECSVANGSASAVRLEYLDDLTSTWVEETSAQLEVIEAGVRYGFDVPVGMAERRIYQVVVQ